MSSVFPPELRLISRIAVHFRHLPADEAAAAVADHLTKFWEPRMKARLMAEVADDATGFDPIVVAAVARLR
jgi:formate dehydrogenase subunit delta